jgi:hypothetical protein
MATLLGNNTAQLDDTTLVIYREGRKPINPERKRDLARRCGVNFIRLRYKGSISTPIGVSGFQHVKLQSRPRKDGGVEPVAQWHKNIYTNEDMAEGAMDFVPDEMGSAYAYMPDGPFNRVRLAYAQIAGNAVWEIDDNERVKTEIDELANKIRESIQYRIEMEDLRRQSVEVEMRVRERNIKTGIEHKTKLEIEIGVLQEQVKSMELEQKRNELKKRLADLQGFHPELSAQPQAVIPPQTTVRFVEAPPPDDLEKPDSSDENDNDDNDDNDDRESENAEANGEKSRRSVGARRQAKADVHNANSELIEGIKERFFKKTGKRRGWAFSPEYREKIIPLIEQRVMELIDEYTATSVTVEK